MHNKIIFELVHIRANCSPKRLGLYSTIHQISDAIDYYTMRLGFQDFPDGFITIPHQFIPANKASNVVYLAEAYYHDDEYSLEYVVPLGVFASTEDAKKSIAQYKEANKRALDPEISIELLAERYLLDQRLWPEGFIVD